MKNPGITKMTSPCKTDPFFSCFILRFLDVNSLGMNPICMRNW
jgi:hypothetical protein